MSAQLAGVETDTVFTKSVNNGDAGYVSHQPANWL